MERATAAVDGAGRASEVLAGRLRAIVGIEVMISRVQAKAKLSQNRPAADSGGVIYGLQARGDHASGSAVRAARKARSGVIGVRCRLTARQQVNSAGPTAVNLRIFAPRRSNRRNLKVESATHT